MVEIIWEAETKINLFIVLKSNLLENFGHNRICVSCWQLPVDWCCKFSLQTCLSQTSKRTLSMVLKFLSDMHCLFDGSRMSQSKLFNHLGLSWKAEKVTRTSSISFAGQQSHLSSAHPRLICLMPPTAGVFLSLTRGRASVPAEHATIDAMLIFCFRKSINGDCTLRGTSNNQTASILQQQHLNSPHARKTPRKATLV